MAVTCHSSPVERTDGTSNIDVMINDQEVLLERSDDAEKASSAPDLGLSAPRYGEVDGKGLEDVSSGISSTGDNPTLEKDYSGPLAYYRPYSLPFDDVNIVTLNQGHARYYGKAYGRGLGKAYLKKKDAIEIPDFNFSSEPLNPFYYASSSDLEASLPVNPIAFGYRLKDNNRQQKGYYG